MKILKNKYRKRSHPHCWEQISEKVKFVEKFTSNTQWVDTSLRISDSKCTSQLAVNFYYQNNFHPQNVKITHDYSHYWMLATLILYQYYFLQKVRLDLASPKFNHYIFALSNSCPLRVYKSQTLFRKSCTHFSTLLSAYKSLKKSDDYLIQTTQELS